MPPPLMIYRYQASLQMRARARHDDDCRAISPAAMPRQLIRFTLI